MSQFLLNLEPSPLDGRDWVAETIYTTEAQLEDEIDYRPQLRTVRNQGSYGTCAAQVGACMKEWQEHDDVLFNEYMSPWFIYQNRENQDSEGMYCRDLMKILHKIGSAPEVLYPYATQNPIEPEVYEKALHYKIKGYAQVYTIEGLKTALKENGPCLIAVPVFNFGTRMWYSESGQGLLGGHAMTIVGYNSEGFIVRNSWGSSWGNNGCCIMFYEDWGWQWEVWTTVDADTIKVAKKDRTMYKIPLFNKRIQTNGNRFKIVWR